MGLWSNARKNANREDQKQIDILSELQDNLGWPVVLLLRGRHHSR